MAGVGRGAVPAGGGPEERALAARIDPLFAAVGEGTPGAMVLVAREGRVLLERGYGAANLERRQPISAGTRFRIGSVTKVFTAAAIWKLQEQGRLRVEDTLSQYFPDWPGGDAITLSQLLSHTSGIRNYTGKPEFARTVTTGITLNALIRSFRDDAPDFAPGSKCLYSNSGYVLLAALIERISGQSYGHFLQRTFLDPLGLRDTGVFPDHGALAGMATGYAQEKGSVRRAESWHPDQLAGCGALYSTAHDLFLWNEALFGGRVLRASTLRRAMAVAALALDDPAHPEETGYGLGWYVDRLRGQPEVSHGGELAGFGSYLLRLPEQKLTVVVLLNCVPQYPGLQQWVLARTIAERALEGELPPAVEPQVDPTVTEEALARVAGRYDLGGGQVLTVTQQEGRVFMEITGRPRTEILPRNERTFFVRGAAAEATFVRDPAGQVVKAILQQGGARIDAPRMREGY